MKTLTILLLTAAILSGCKTFEPAKYSEFVRTTDFTQFDSYAIGEVTVTEFGRFYREPEVQAATLAALKNGMEALGYAADTEETPDVTVSARWQLVSALILRERSNEPFKLNTTPGGRPVADKRYNLVIEVADAEGIFWAYESNDRVIPREFTAARAAALVEKAILRFPESTLF